MSECVGYWIIGHYPEDDEEIEGRISDKGAAISYAKECSEKDEVYCSVYEKAYIQTGYAVDEERDEIYDDYDVVGEELVWSNNPALKDEVVE